MIHELGEDPTKIDIAFDPRHQRMRGMATHGMTPFDVPFISRIRDNLWQGGCQDGLILPEFFTGVVSLYPWEKYTINHAGVERIEVKMYDSVGQTFEQVDEIAAEVIRLMDKGPTLVHCQAGLNRSSLVAARVLMIKYGMDGTDAINMLRDNRSPACLCNPAFYSYIDNNAVVK